MNQFKCDPMKEEYVVRKRNSLFKFSPEVEYKDLAPIFPELFRFFMKLADQYPEEGEEEYIEMLIQLNLRDLKNNKKPIGHNREARYRMIFPLGREGVQFFIYPRIDEDESEIGMITDKISKFLAEKGLEHEVLWDRMKFLLKKKD